MQFPVKPLAYGLALMAGAGLLGACGGGSNNDGPRIQVSPANAYLLTSNNRIIGVDLDDTEFARTVAAIAQNTSTTSSVNALDVGEEILDIDYRNAEGLLYGLTRVGSEGRIILIDPINGTVFRRGRLVIVGDASAMPPTTDQNIVLNPNTNYTIDFNPAVDKLRILGSDGTNLRVTIDANSSVTAATPTIAATLQDDSLNCGTPAATGCTEPLVLTGAAYTDERSMTPPTRLFGMDTRNTYALNANAGTVTTVRALGVSGVTRVNGYDINPSNEQGVAVFTIASTPSVYAVDSTLNATTSAATFLTSLPVLPSVQGTQEQYTGLSLVTGANPTVAP
ncbi:uncharacterized protein DUF4394 [Paraperlucidibaca baekdonensis]|uniref:Uncharacterized protein DUF4394 n=1 Tax=Paraperlucidibaca baekdonensis TaxID=748120 RepID=A0A3E0H3I1_9GAMM|nr:DUF4394 domain-containing protein [Paraperlucidibaca baekdonensis]REH37701.1 uncharacterized protein DUF4394 [Paraperlucidibaca baekdonensis]